MKYLKYIIFTLLIFSDFAFSHTIFYGNIKDYESGEPLDFASIRIKNSKLGGYTNKKGDYQLHLNPGVYNVIFSMVGKVSEERLIKIDRDSVRLDISLKNTYKNTADVIVIAEDPGAQLMRKVIARKKHQTDSLQTYSYLLYSKFTAATDTITAGRTDKSVDTTIVSIFESYSRGYFKKPDVYYNEIYQRRQTQNIPPQANFVVFGTNLNAYDDNVSIVGEIVATPFHPDAIDYYDFFIEDTVNLKKMRNAIRVVFKPKSSLRKLCEGEIFFDPETLVPYSINFKPNKAVQLPFNAKMEYFQKFEEVTPGYIMPSIMRIKTSLVAELFYIVAPRIDLNIETIAYNYEINPKLDDKLFENRRVEVSPNVDKIDTNLWNENQLLPLRKEEAEAYLAIQNAIENPDSVVGTNFFTQYLTPIRNFFAQFNQEPFTGFDNVFRYNRVHGAYLGLGVKYDFFENIRVNTNAGYGFLDKKIYYDFKFNFFLDSLQKFGLYGNIYNRLDRIDNPFGISTSFITAFSLFFKNDYGDYYYNRGWEIGYEMNFGQKVFLKRDEFGRIKGLRLYYKNEDQSSAHSNALFSLNPFHTSFRGNPTIIPGNLRTAGIEVYYNYSRFRRIGNFGIYLNYENSQKDLVGGDFDFSRLYGEMNLRFFTMPLWRLTSKLYGAYSWGSVPMQKFYPLEGSGSVLAGNTVFKNMRNKEFFGDKFLALSFDHNFGEVFPGVLRIPNVASFGIEFIGFSSIGWTTFSDKAIFAKDNNGILIIPNSTSITKDKYYLEAGFSLNRILLIFRTDFVFRFTQVSSPYFGFTFNFVGV
jgi:hypothetical protein